MLSTLYQRFCRRRSPDVTYLPAPRDELVGPWVKVRVESWTTACGQPPPHRRVQRAVRRAITDGVARLPASTVPPITLWMAPPHGEEICWYTVTGVTISNVVKVRLEWLSRQAFTS